MFDRRFGLLEPLCQSSHWRAGFSEIGLGVAQGRVMNGERTRQRIDALSGFLDLMEKLDHILTPAQPATEFRRGL